MLTGFKRRSITSTLNGSMRQRTGIGACSLLLGMDAEATPRMTAHQVVRRVGRWSTRPRKSTTFKRSLLLVAGDVP